MAEEPGWKRWRLRSNTAGTAAATRSRETDLRCPVSWRGNGDIGVPPDSRVCLCFRLRHAELFGFEWRG